MTVVSIKEGGGVRDPVFRIGLSDGSLFSFKAAYLDPAFREGPPWEPGRELAAGEEGALRFAAACYRAEKLALQLVSRAEQCCRGLSRKLELRGQAAPVVQAALGRLVELDIVDDRRYAARWLQARLNRRGATPRRLLAALAARGIDRETAAAALKKTLDAEGELRLLEGYLEKKKLVFDGSDGREPSDSQRLSLKYRLKGEGFSGAVLDRYREERE